MDCKKFFLFFLVMVGCAEDRIINAERQLADQLAGQWEIETAINENYLMEEWEGLPFSFEKSGPTEGIYEMPLSVNDSVWPIDGSWLVMDENTLLRDGVKPVTVLPDVEGAGTLLLTFDYPSRISNEDLCMIDTVQNDTVCILPIIEGYWTFILNKVD